MKNNKGFSLVELIIVIAIMAILVGVMAPQLIKYVEKTNESADAQLCDSVRTALTTASMDPDVVKNGGTIADTGSGTYADIAGISTGSARSAAEEILGMSLSDVEGKLKSKSAKSHDVEYMKDGNQVAVRCAGNVSIFSAN